MLREKKKEIWTLDSVTGEISILKYWWSNPVQRSWLKTLLLELNIGMVMVREVKIQNGGVTLTLFNQRNILILSICTYLRIRNQISPISLTWRVSLSDSGSKSSAHSASSLPDGDPTVQAAEGSSIHDPTSVESAPENLKSNISEETNNYDAANHFEGKETDKHSSENGSASEDGNESDDLSSSSDGEPVERITDGAQ